MKKFIASLFCLAAFSANAADWVMVATTKNQNVYIDNSSYSFDKNNKTVQFWEKFVNANEKSTKYDTKSLSVYNCKNKTSFKKTAVEYYNDGTTKGSYGKTASHDIVPDTIGDELWSIACGTFGKGFDYKYNKLFMFNSIDEYYRAMFAYGRLNPKEYNGKLYNYDPKLNINDAEILEHYESDVEMSMYKARERFLKKK